jgi:hypothetical protein
VTPRQLRFSRLFIGVLFAGLGIWALADANYGMGAFWLVASAFWLLMGAFLWRRPRDVRSQGDT